jgi:hypothetical protein
MHRSFSRHDDLCNLSDVLRKQSFEKQTILCPHSVHHTLLFAGAGEGAAGMFRQTGLA